MAGTVEGFTPITDAMLRNPNAEDWAHAAPRLQRDELRARLDETDTGERASAPARVDLADARRRHGSTGAARVRRHTLSREHGRHHSSARRETGDLDLGSNAVGAEIAPRGPRAHENKLIFQSAGEWAAAGRAIIALDARTGETIWNVEMPDVYATNSGPIVANGLLIQGGGTCTVYEETKCSISAYDPRRARRSGSSAPSRSRASPAATVGAGQIFTAPVAKRITGSYDPDLNLTYWGTAQAKPWMPASRGMHTNDVALYTSSTLALNATTGALAWHYAHAPGEAFDLDVVFERACRRRR